MKILIIGDVHWSTYSSIIRSRGTHYSLRLENLTRSLDWVEEQAIKNKCNAIVYLGDFFDHNHITDEEASALKHIMWTNIQHYFIVGNHESSVNGLRYNSTDVLANLGEKFTVVAQPTSILIKDLDLTVHFIPYIVESDRKDLKSYLNTNTKKNIVFSHNDIKGIKYGFVESKTGFEIKDIEANCNLYLNGHLHNAEKITDKIINVGNISGQNFSENALVYKHGCYVLDTDTLQLEFIENPYAFNFYKIDINTKDDLNQLDILKDNAVVTVKCPDELLNVVREVLKSKLNVIEYRTISTREINESDNKEAITQLRGKNHLEQFNNFILDTCGDSDLVKEELSEVLR